MINWWRTKQQSHVALVFAIAKEQVSLMIADITRAEPALIVSDHCEVTDGQWAVGIQTLVHRYEKQLKGKPPVLLVVSPSLYQSFQLDRPQLPSAEITQALKYHLRDLVPLAPTEIIADYYDNSVQLAGQDKITAIVMAKAMLVEILACIDPISDKVQGIVTEEQAIAELFSELMEPTVVVHKNSSEPALLQVYQLGALQVNRQVRTLDGVGQLTTKDIEQGDAGALSVEVQRSADYFERQLRQRPIRQVVLALNVESRSALQQQLASDLGLAVQWAAYPVWAQELGRGDYADFAALGGMLLVQKMVATSTQERAAS
ncbi:hypothetical protein SAMN02927930_01273 [Pseudidiomarina indica]|uniref:MSHA biogenesis protein MshI n=1 Tax=Pseudidiomarina indica TaxID=1159017 RepID=A0A1G6CK78_9GAMM|nr:hypothetical protein [Pseudidiomarina indica]SDB33269.1 hypothetical protein SAMN02927930_01273 [Pseudidiomarina indica]